MARVRGRDTKPEMVVRRLVHGLGFRYRLHDKKLPGRPDLVFRPRRKLIFVHGCFWHRHDCPLFRWPQTRQDFWREKINGNARRDAEAVRLLLDVGWRVGIVWECALKGRGKRPFPEVIDSLSLWLSSDTKQFCVEGQWID